MADKARDGMVEYKGESRVDEVESMAQHMSEVEWYL